MTLTRSVHSNRKTLLVATMLTLGSCLFSNVAAFIPRANKLYPIFLLQASDKEFLKTMMQQVINAICLMRLTRKQDNTEYIELVYTSVGVWGTGDQGRP